MAKANNKLCTCLAAYKGKVDTHNANHALNQATIVQQKSYLHTHKQRCKGPVAKLTSTKHQYWITGGSMQRAVRRQNWAVHQKAADKNWSVVEQSSCKY
jgi:hypothetical protein